MTIEERVNALEANMPTRQWMQDLLLEWKSEMRERLNQQDQKIDNLNNRFDHMESRFDNLEKLIRDTHSQNGHSSQ